MNDAKLYGIYTALFPFLDASEGKIRPVIVVSGAHGQHNVIAIVPISSRMRREDIDVNLIGWNNEGLMRPSIARVHRLTTMMQSDLLAELGSLTPSDANDLQLSMRDFLGL